MTIMKIDKAYKVVHLVYESCKPALEKLNELRNDEFFVSLGTIFGSEFEVMDEWLFENNIVAKKERVNFEIPNTELQFTISGYRFKNIEHAMAFKLRWYNDR